MNGLKLTDCSPRSCIIGRIIRTEVQSGVTMKFSMIVGSTALVLGLLSVPVLAANPMVGGAAMYETKNIVENAANSADHTTLVAAVKAAGLVEALMGPGPFTVFAPTNEAFAALPAGTVDTLLKPENKAMLTKVLTAHVVAGSMSTADLARCAKKSSDGFCNLTTLSGDSLSAQAKGNNLYIYDESGNASKVTVSDVIQSNGIIQVVDAVLVPK